MEGGELLFELRHGRSSTVIDPVNRFEEENISIKVDCSDGRREIECLKGSSQVFLELSYGALAFIHPTPTQIFISDLP